MKHFIVALILLSLASCEIEPVREVKVKKTVDTVEVTMPVEPSTDTLETRNLRMYIVDREGQIDTFYKPLIVSKEPSTVQQDDTVVVDTPEQPLKLQTLPIYGIFAEESTTPLFLVIQRNGKVDTIKVSPTVETPKVKFRKYRNSQMIPILKGDFGQAFAWARVNGHDYFDYYGRVIKVK